MFVRERSGVAHQSRNQLIGGLRASMSSESQIINIKFRGEGGNEVFFRVKRNTQMLILMNAYCDRESIELSSARFLLDGRRLRVEQTPDELEMEEGEVIDVILQRTGGAVA